jgi:LuxR family maltose regulon positive regulatory protein
VVTPVGPELPDLPERYVPRPRLEKRLAAAVDEARVTAIVAPAVSGKTTLIAGWHEAGGSLPLAYVALDAYDNELARFCSKLVGALQHVHPGRGATALAELASSGEPARFLDILLPELSTIPRTVLAFDGLEVVTNPDLLRVLGDLLVGLPDSLRIVLSSRSEPPLRLGLLRARGQMTEIPAADLAFDNSEVAAFLATFEGLEFAPDETLALHERTEGWAGGVSLAALAAAQHDDPLTAIRGFTGSNRYVADLLGREVLEPQSAELRDFLLTTSVLEVLDAKLCDLVVGRTDSGAVLERLHRSGMFTEAVDDERTNYRYAPLFREFLQRELRVLDPERERAAHRTAAAELEHRGDISAAVDHYVAADLPADGVRLVLGNAERYAADGAVETVRHWLAVLPDDALTDDVGQMLEVSGLCLMSGQWDEADLWLDRVRLRLDELDDPILRAHHALLVGYARAQVGDLEGAVAEGNRVIALAADEPTIDNVLPDRAAHLMAAASAALDEFEAAHRYRSSAPPSLDTEVPTDSYSSWLCYREGRLERALDHANRVLDAGLPPWQWGTVLVTRGAVHRERNFLDEAETDLVQALELARRWYRPRATVFGSIERALVHYAQGRSTEAFEVLSAARRDVHGVFVGQRLDVVEAGLRLADGDLEGSRAIRRELPTGRLTTLLDVRIALAEDELDRALTLVTAAEASARSVRDRISARLLHAQVVHTADPDTATNLLRWAIDLGRQERFVQVFVEDLGPLEAALRRLCAAQDDPYAFSLLAAITHEVDGTPSDAWLTETLSIREQIVLRYLPTALSNKRIAEELHMSVNTLKTHLKNVYRKLGVGSRDEAVAHARHLKLL